MLCRRSALAEDERQRIVRRANDGRTAAKARGARFGRKPIRDFAGQENLRSFDGNMVVTPGLLYGAPRRSSAMVSLLSANAQLKDTALSGGEFATETVSVNSGLLIFVTDTTA